MEKGPLSIVSVVSNTYNTYYVIEGVWNRLGSRFHKNWFEPIGGDVLVIWSCEGDSLGRREVVIALRVECKRCLQPMESNV